jgi:hypothetical protein
MQFLAQSQAEQALQKNILIGSIEVIMKVQTLYPLYRLLLPLAVLGLMFSMFSSVGTLNVARAQEESTPTSTTVVENPTDTPTIQVLTDTPTPPAPTYTPTLPAATDTPTVQVPTDTPTDQPPTETPSPTSHPDYLRPIVVVTYYSASGGSVKPGSDFNLTIQLKNSGQGNAHNVVATFTGVDLIPRQTGGVIAVGMMQPENHADLFQPLSAIKDLEGKTLVSIEMQLTYMDEYGSAFSEKFTLTFSVEHPVVQPGRPAATPTPTPTATSVPDLRPQLVITGYTTDIPILQPGSKFNITLLVKNMGNAAAKRITMIVGGGSSNVPSPGETPGPYGTFAASGEFTNFAPLGASNIQTIGDLGPGRQISPEQSMVVNVTTNPGAYSMKVAFVYVDEDGRYFADEQVITLLVYSLPIVDINFYMETGPMFAGQPNLLPLQVINLGKKSAVLGNMRVTAEQSEVMNNTVLVGALETGGYFPLDAMIIPFQPGSLDIVVTVDYTDDFGQSQKITKVITVEVMEGQIFEPHPPEGPGYEPEPVFQGNETFWQKALRFVKGLFGLSSGLQNPHDPGNFPGEAPPMEPGVKPIPGPGKG